MTNPTINGIFGSHLNLNLSIETYLEMIEINN